MTDKTLNIQNLENIDLQNIKNINLKSIDIDILYKYCIITVSFLSIILLAWGIFLINSHYSEKDLGGKKDIRFTYYVWLGQSNGVIPTIIQLLSIPIIMALIYNVIR